MPRSEQPASRRERPAKPPLSLRAIVEVALAVMRAEGLDRVTMRRIATELDTGPASLYVYVANAAALHGAMLDELLADLALPATVTARTWRKAVIGVLTEYTRILFEQPSLARSVLVLRPSGPRYLALWDWMLAALRMGGIPVRDSAWGVDLLLQHATATAAEHGTRREDRTAEAEAADPAAAAGWDAEPDRYPGLAWAGGELFSGTGAERFSWQLERILAGIATST